MLVGCGKMGRALLDGWLDRGVPASEITVIEPVAEARATLPPTLTVCASAEELSQTVRPKVIVFAVKPQGMEAVLPAYRRYDDATFLSIAAGRTIAFFTQHLGESAAVVRAMPNTPASVRRGISVACASPAVDASRRASCRDLLEAVGEVAWIEDEGLMDAVTALSGSGPAYVFLLAEVLAAAGTKAGLPDELATRLARATVAGAGELIRLSPEPTSVLRRNVTSPGGTTAAALDVLMAEDGLATLMERAVRAATRRSRELAG